MSNYWDTVKYWKAYLKYLYTDLERAYLEEEFNSKKLELLRKYAVPEDNGRFIEIYNQLYTVQTQIIVIKHNITYAQKAVGRFID
ncbi:MAG: 10.3 kDa unknown protein [Plant associated caulimovirus 1]|nr:MAG: 10.3 kDa unknown protein [Plant associated caulimovirus 1]